MEKNLVKLVESLLEDVSRIYYNSQTESLYFIPECGGFTIYLSSPAPNAVRFTFSYQEDNTKGAEKNETYVINDFEMCRPLLDKIVSKLNRHNNTELLSWNEDRYSLCHEKMEILKECLRGNMAFSKKDSDRWHITENNLNHVVLIKNVEEAKVEKVFSLLSLLEVPVLLDIKSNDENKVSFCRMLIPGYEFNTYPELGMPDIGANDISTFLNNLKSSNNNRMRTAINFNTLNLQLEQKPVSQNKLKV